QFRTRSRACRRDSRKAPAPLRFHTKSPRTDYPGPRSNALHEPKIRSDYIRRSPASFPYEDGRAVFAFGVCTWSRFGAGWKTTVSAWARMEIRFSGLLAESNKSRSNNLPLLGSPLRGSRRRATSPFAENPLRTQCNPQPHHRQPKAPSTYVKHPQLPESRPSRDSSKCRRAGSRPCSVRRSDRLPWGGDGFTPRFSQGILAGAGLLPLNDGNSNAMCYL